ncbi:MAG: GntR family transcriptional regulator [Pseudomonadota bacterium]
MQEPSEFFERRTAADVVFDNLQSEIVSLRLLPRTKLSEVEVARRFGVSRQPVRDAFARLAREDLLLIRPQKATEVRGFSMKQIAHARFVRLAVELEVVHRACAAWDSDAARVLEENTTRQHRAIESQNFAEFHTLDYEFHKSICDRSGYPLAAQTIEDCKKKIDRICVLSLGREAEVEALFEDHLALSKALSDGAVEQSRTILRRHLERLDQTIADIHVKHASYFE